MDILERIKQLQRKKGWTNYQLSAETGIPQSTITNMFNRKTLPSITTLIAICKAFDLSLSQFFNQDETNIIFSSDEQQLILAYRKLNKKNKNLIKLIIKELN